MASQSSERRTQQERVAESSRRLLEAAIELIALQGYERTTLAEISERAGYSRPMANVRYGSKEALLEVIMRTEFEDRINADPDTGLPGLDRVLDRIDQLDRLYAEDRQGLRAMFVLSLEAVGPVPALRPHMIDWMDRLVVGLTEAVAAGQRDGSVRADLQPDAAAEHVLNTGIGIAYRWVLAPETFDFPARLARWRSEVREALSS